ncbi:hypothetical protein M9Y10_041424 [Tritrichomonas musculus]|uniref:Proteasome alpha-type subunits domain-containing protein n=1 Tax=Tritrichomonas musculus TaxID=1915356 RepID=A0ABR2K7D8_9EUKA
MFRQYDQEFGFSPDGRLLQNEYAGKAASQGPLVIGITSKSSVILIAQKQNSNPLLVSNESDSINQISTNIYAGVSGLPGDSRTFINNLRTNALNYQSKFGTECNIQSLVRDSLDSIHPNNMGMQNYGYSRPLGCSFLVAGEHTKLVKGSTSSGSCTGCFAGAIGTGAEAAELYLTDHFQKELSEESAQQLAIDALHNVYPDAQYMIKIVK